VLQDVAVVVVVVVVAVVVRATKEPFATGGNHSYLSGQ